VTKTLTVLAVAAIASAGLLSAGANSAQLAVGVTVVRSCVIEARPADTASLSFRLTCATGAQSNVRVTEPVQQPARTVSTDGHKVVTINF
jgi:hypothetical protein